MPIRGIARRVARAVGTRRGAAAIGASVAEYWTEHNVTAHHRFSSAQGSLDYLHWRNDQYFCYIEFMPVTDQDGKVVVDFGCGPGHDLVGFGTYSKPRRLVGMDVSGPSLAEARGRLALHGIDCELIQLQPQQARLPLEDRSVDYVHSSGVLHHTPDPLQILRDFRRVLRNDGAARVMVYNYDSIWLHLYVAYEKMLLEPAFAGLDVRAAFAKTTDGPDCPISQVYRPLEFVTLADQAGFDATFIGACVSMHESGRLMARRFDAIAHPQLRAESRRFLLELTYDTHGFAMYNGHYAGVDGCYLLHPRA